MVTNMGSLPIAVADNWLMINHIGRRFSYDCPTQHTRLWVEKRMARPFFPNCNATVTRTTAIICHNYTGCHNQRGVVKRLNTVYSCGFIYFAQLGGILLFFGPMRKVTRTTKTTSLTAFFLLSLLVTTTLVLPSPLVTPVYAQDGDVLSQLDPAAQTVALSINQQRANAGLPLLALHPLLNLAAQVHVNDMVANYNYSHYGTDGSNVKQRVQRTGYGSAWASENWVSVSSPDLAIQWWMNSRVHRGNILNVNWHEYGIGFGSHPSNGELIFVAVFAAGQNGDASQIVMPPPPEPLPIPAGGVDYTVRAGDTLLSIGLRFGIEWPVIATANGLSEYSLLQIGQVIRLPGVDSIGGPVIEESQAAASVVEEESTGDTFVRRYTVQKGDTLVGIATIYGITWEELARENRLSEFSVISVGEQLRIPGAVKRAEQPMAEAAADATTAPTTTETVSAASATATESASPEYYVVKSGDTIISIATRHNMGWHELLTLNNLAENSILQLDQKLRVR